MGMPNNTEVLRDEAHNNAIREALVELYKLKISGVNVDEAIKAIETLIRK